MMYKVTIKNFSKFRAHYDAGNYLDKCVSFSPQFDRYLMDGAISHENNSNGTNCLAQTHYKVIYGIMYCVKQSIGFDERILITFAGNHDADNMYAKFTMENNKLLVEFSEPDNDFVVLYL